MSLLPVECARSSAVSQSWRCQVGAWLEPSGLEGSYHSCQITDSLTPPLPTSPYCFFVSLKHSPDGSITHQQRDGGRESKKNGKRRSEFKVPTAFATRDEVNRAGAFLLGREREWKETGKEGCTSNSPLLIMAGSRAKLGYCLSH